MSAAAPSERSGPSPTSPEHTIRFVVEGDGGILPASVATSLAVVLNELLQNAVDHAYPRELAQGHEAARHGPVRPESRIFRKVLEFVGDP